MSAASRLGTKACLFSLAAAAAFAQNDETVEKAVRRISEEAEAFSREAPKLLGVETLQQRSLAAVPRFRLLTGGADLKTPTASYRQRELISEYGFTALKDSPQNLRELRRVTKVDNRRVESDDKARHTLTMGITSENDKLKKRMLEDFEKHGLVGAAVDFGQIILLFRKRALSQYKFSVLRTERLGADTTLVLGYSQVKNATGLTVFESRKAYHMRLDGEIWVRQNDFVPLRVTFVSVRTEEEGKEKKERAMRHEARVDYLMSAYGVLTPASVTHRQYVNQVMVAENQFRYETFRKFQADAEIKFTEVPEQKP